MPPEEGAAVNTQTVASDTTTTASATEENKSSEVQTNPTGEYSSADVGTESKNQSSEGKTDDTATGPQDPVQTDETNNAGKTGKGADQRKQQLSGDIQDLKNDLGISPNTEIRDLVSARNALRQAVEQANSQAYGVATEQELLGQINPETGTYYNPLEAKVAALADRQQLDRYNTQVADAQLTLSTDAHRALQDFPMFDPQSKEYKPEVAAQVDALLGASLVVDRNTGMPIGSHIPVYQLYQAVAASSQASAVAGQIAGQRATEQMLASADNAGGSGTQQETPFEKLTTAQMRERLRAKGHDV